MVFSAAHKGYAFSMKAAKVLTFDHIIPSIRGGKTTWEIVVAACPPIASRQSHLREVFTQYILG
jgi:hypothetical protein